MSHLARTNGLSAITIINSCAVTQEAVRQTKQTVRRAHKNDPRHKIFITGCATETDKEFFVKMPEVSGIIDNAHKLSNPMFARQSLAPQARTRALLQIQTGCDWQCSFCITRIARGRARSRSIESLIKEANFLFSQGHLEITLTGVDIASYGKDFSRRCFLGDLVERLLQETPEGLKFRLSSLDPAAVDEKLFHLLVRAPRLQPFLHLSIQSGDNIILKRMKRRHTPAQVIALCAALRKERAFTFGADFIVGFPTESEAQFQNSKALIEACDIVFAHIFPYSARAGTAAARMPKLDSSCIKTRAARLREYSDKKLESFLQAQVGTRQKFLAETAHSGRSDNNCRAIWQEPLTANAYYEMNVRARADKRLKVERVALA